MHLQLPKQDRKKNVKGATCSENGHYKLKELQNEGVTH